MRTSLGYFTDSCILINGHCTVIALTVAVLFAIYKAAETWIVVLHVVSTMKTILNEKNKPQNKR